jgi:hypothetical protein
MKRSFRKLSGPDALRRTTLLAVSLIAASQCVFGQYTPTISGVNAFWFLGTGILADGGMCSPRESGLLLLCPIAAHLEPKWSAR